MNSKDQATKGKTNKLDLKLKYSVSKDSNKKSEKKDYKIFSNYIYDETSI